MTRRILWLANLLTLLTVSAQAHDTWVETNTPIVRAGEYVHVDLKLGNHGNGHRDFKLASKIALDKCTLSVIDPAGTATDLKPDAIDTGFSPKEGYWSARYVTSQEGQYVVAHTLDTLHGTTRAIKSGKTWFVASKTLDHLPDTLTGYDQPLGHPLELIPVVNPVTSQGPGQKLTVKLLYQGKPLPGTRVSFIPRGAQLAEGQDDDYEQITDAQGMATFTPTEGNLVLVVAHHPVADQKGNGYDKTHYSATLTVAVPSSVRIASRL